MEGAKASEMKGNWSFHVFSLAELKEVGFTASDLKDVGYGLRELHDVGFAAADLKDLDYGLRELKDMAMFILLPSIKFRLWVTPQKTFFIVRSFVCLLVARFFCRRDFFFGHAKILKKKFGSTRSIPSKNRRNRSHPRDF